MGLVQKRVLEGTKDEFRQFLADKLAAVLDVVEGKTSATARQRKDAQIRLETLETVLSDFDDWELTAGGDVPPADPPGAPANGDVEAQRRAAAAASV